MEFHYDVIGSERKNLVEAISEILGCSAVYQGAPTFCYVIGNYIVDYLGTLTFTDDADYEETKWLVTTLKEHGYEMITSDTLTVMVPREGIDDEALENLRKIVASKQTLIKKALKFKEEGDLPIDIVNDGNILSFPWFTLTGMDGETDAYTRFTNALCEMAKTLKRVIAKERDLENDKFTMRLFLIRLGFVGNEYKAARKILLRYLTGNSSWKSGQRPEQATENGEGDNTL